MHDLLEPELKTGVLRLEEKMSKEEQLDCGSDGEQQMEALMEILHPEKLKKRTPLDDKRREKMLKASEAYKTAPKVVPGGAVVYVGHLPRGFEEPQLKGYFSQYGEIVRLRMRRNPRTGASRHAAFIEFRHQEVASIVVESMNNYILGGRVLKLSLVPEEKVHAEMWKGANHRFVKVDHRAAFAKKHNESSLLNRDEKKIKGLLNRVQKKCTQQNIDYDCSSLPSTIDL